MLFHIFALLSEGGNDISIGIELAGSDSNVITRPDRIIQSWPLPSVHIYQTISWNLPPAEKDEKYQWLCAKLEW